MAWVSRFRLLRAARHLRQGGLLAYPTEAVYGLGCDPLNGDAVARLLALKNRAVSKGLILLGAGFEQIEPFIRLDSEEVRRRLLDSWPGPTTWVVPSRAWVPSWLCREDRTLAVRVTAHNPSAELCRAFGGPIVSTSANPGSARPARSRVKVARYFCGTDMEFLPGNLGGLSRPTAIYDALSGKRLR